MLQRLCGDVYCWTERHGKPETTYYWYSFAIHINQAGVFALIDPLPMSNEEIIEIEKIGRPTHILLTCNWHLRASEQYRQRWNCQIYINELGLAESEAKIDGIFRHGDRLWNVVEMIHLPDVSGWKEETAFLIHEEKGLLIVGDAVCGGRADVGIPDGGSFRFFKRQSAINGFRFVTRFPQIAAATELGSLGGNNHEIRNGRINPVPDDCISVGRDVSG